MWKLKDEKTIPRIKYNRMSIVHGITEGEVFKFCLTGKFWVRKHFNDENLLNKKSEFISKCRHENKLLVKPAEKWIVLLVLILLYRFSFHN